jgi:hypothetical protein
MLAAKKLYYIHKRREQNPKQAKDSKQNPTEPTLLTERKPKLLSGAQRDRDGKPKRLEKENKGRCGKHLQGRENEHTRLYRNPERVITSQGFLLLIVGCVPSLLHSHGSHLQSLPSA